jgi:Mn-dependent DtxR family transcriptional regulator
MFSIIKIQLKQNKLIYRKEVIRMTDKSFMRVEDVAKELDVSKSYAYKIVQKLNKELEDKGYITISGRVNRQYFLERTCYGSISENQERKG